MNKTKDKLEEIIERAVTSHNTVIHTPTERSDDLLMDRLNDLGYVWCTRNNYKKGFAKDNYKKDQCYLVSEGSHSDINYFRRKNYIIINLEEELFGNVKEKEEYLFKSLEYMTDKLSDKKVIFHRFEIDGRLITLGLGRILTSSPIAYGISMSIRDEVDATKFNEEESLELGRKIVRGRIEKEKFVTEVITGRQVRFLSSFMSVKIAKGFLIEVESQIRKKGLKSFIKAKI
jgi:hypothetical protein